MFLFSKENKRFSDNINPYLIGMWKGLLEGMTYPETITKETYNEAKTAYNTKDYTIFSAAELGWIGFMASYNGLFFHSYTGVSKSDGKDYVKASIDNIKQQIAPMKGCELRCCSYDALEIPPDSIIYCDPPYQGTEGYGVDFDYPKFYGWCHSMKQAGHKIFVSEYSMPPEFTCIWSMEVSNSLDRFSKVREKRLEKLFTIN